MNCGNNDGYGHKQALKQLTNTESVEWILLGKNNLANGICIAQTGGIPATDNIAKHAGRLKNLGAMSKHGDIVLVGVGLTAACMQIANTTDTKEKNEIFVETITSTAVGGIAGAVIGLFLISNPIGWGTAIVLAVDNTATSYGLGKLARNTTAVPLTA